MRTKVSDIPSDEIDWSLTTWEGARREQLRRWAALPLENVVAALEEMRELVDWLHPAGADVDAQRISGGTGPVGKTPQS